MAKPDSYKGHCPGCGRETLTPLVDEWQWLCDSPDCEDCKEARAALADVKADMEAHGHRKVAH